MCVSRCDYNYNMRFKKKNKKKPNLFCFFVTLLLVSIPLFLPMFHLTFSAAVIDSVASVAWSEFVF